MARLRKWRRRDPLAQSEASKRHYQLNKPEYFARNKRQRAKNKKETRAYVRRYKEEHPCVDCGQTDWMRLQFDHVRGRKLGNISDLVNQGRSLRKVMREIKKCEVVCAGCHQKRTLTRGQAEQGGTTAGDDYPLFDGLDGLE